MSFGPTAPWQPVPHKTVYQQAEFTGAPMQVGLMAGAWWWTVGDNRTVRFENFMLDRTSGSPLSITRAGRNVNILWPPISGTLQYSLIVSSAVGPVADPLRCSWVSLVTSGDCGALPHLIAASDRRQSRLRKAIDAPGDA